MRGRPRPRRRPEPAGPPRPAAPPVRSGEDFADLAGDDLETGAAEPRPDQGARRASRPARPGRGGSAPGSAPRPAARPAGRPAGRPGWNLVENRFALVLLVLLALGAVYGVAEVTRPGFASGPEEAPVGRRAQVVSAVQACPGSTVRTEGDTRAAVLSLPGVNGRGRADVLELDPAGEAGQRLDQPGELWQSRVGPRVPPTVVDARGALAAGLAAGQVSHALRGGDRQLAGTRCVEPGTDFWFVGPGRLETRDLQVVLTNPDDRAAAVDIELFSDSGPLDTTVARGIPMPARSRRVMSLAELTETARLVALHVRTSTGRVAAAARARMDRGQGADWLPVTQPPSTRLVVPGLRFGPGLRRLIVGAPGEADAQVRLTAVASDGSYAPRGFEGLDVPAGSAASVDLRGLSGKSAAVALESNVPIVAGVLQRAPGDADVAFTAAVPPLTGPAIVPVNPADTGFSSTLYLSATGAQATVSIGVVVPGGAAVDSAATEVVVPAGRTKTVKITPPVGAERGYALVVTPAAGSGPVALARILEHKSRAGLLMTVEPVEPARSEVTLPPAISTLTTVIP